ncbi:hypothetical protein IR083_07665 [Dysgonomonas sp. GY75]|uniref:hypothetical protein n=1 Tax=Dysgonomonas sp. GY75 TaxID=2780419 RepID=UPI001883D211|nr:hypothetical protein [Dysgonomonas sp. GY75]MBF0648694.1 hypothetical protein [Dysgonomonas sp. GY75]
MNNTVKKNQGQSVNRLYASGSYAQIHSLIAEVFKNLMDKVYISRHDDVNEVCHLELSFLSGGGFPYNQFVQIIGNTGHNHGLYIRVTTDEADCPENKQHIFRNGKWDFEEKKSGIRIHNITQSTIYTTGAYMVPFSYTDKEGKTCFAWMVTGFESDTYRDGELLNITDSAGFLDGLTPPADDEERKTEYIIRSLQSSGLQRIELGLYKTMLKDVPSSVYVRRLDDISYAGHITQIESTLDEYLLDSPHFSQTLREILVDTFGRDRRDIFLTDENALVIGCCRANIWKIQEHPHKYIPSESSKQENILPPKQRIQQCF